MKAIVVYVGSDGELTKRYYSELEKRGPLGMVAVNLFRAQKTSTRAKLYRGRQFRSAAYDTKSWSMQNLVEILGKVGGFPYGWKPDPATPFGDAPSWVLYVELPQGAMCRRKWLRRSGSRVG